MKVAQPHNAHTRNMLYLPNEMSYAV